MLGAKGSRWAWRNGRWESVEHFKRVQRLWAIWGAVILDRRDRCCSAGRSAAGFYGLRHSEPPTELGVPTKLRGEPGGRADRARRADHDRLPVRQQSPSSAAAGGRAVLSFSATRPDRQPAVVFLEAVKRDGVWSIRKMMLKPDGSKQGIDIVGGARGGTV